MSKEMQNDISKNDSIGNTFIEFLTLLVKYRIFLFSFISIITIIITLYVIFISDKWYKSSTSVFPAEKTDLLSSLTGLSNLAKGFSASKGLAALTGSNSETDRYMAILLSATVTDDIIKKFNLRKEYERENDFYEKVVKDWKSNFELEVQDEGNLTISVYDKNPQKAADIANYLVERLNEINSNLMATNAKANREFVEKRYQQNLLDINNLEQKMTEYQKKYGLISVPEQLEATVKSMSDIYVKLYEKEIEFNVLKEKFGKDNPITHSSQIEIREIQRKIDLLNSGNDNSQKDVKLLIPFKQAPELGNEFLKIYRNLEIQYKILEFVQPLYEQAKVEEARNTPSVIVLDKAGPSDRKAKPKGSIYALLSFTISSIIAFFIVLNIELFQKLKINHPDKYQYLTEWMTPKFRKIN